MVYEEPDAYELTMDQVVERRGPDRYAAYVPRLGMVGYGDTPAAAEQEADEVMFALLRDISARDGIDAALARLTRAGVTWNNAGVGHRTRSALLVVEHGQLASPRERA